ncbi:hypothetical protein PHAVU_005G047700 [Phaseolus vulgaris]|uniref:Bifunctional inhibitor/plant lipid transfer protein/seed storage helical domain-containing protein n=1 Tax=Phaseolus vulgaris TaxID=3885 RepID=V7BT98_PHAVU|nr:hypothetical protein PHAVU_005G047700g [Phaseolus vulgaris]ESW21169.1 hypothetical protein PHAVU_005G047700g [Phaseolus vulgaris]
MRNSDTKSFWLLVVLVMNVVSVFQHGHKMVAAEDCEEELRGFDIECMYYMNKGDPRILNPNHRCCKVITHAFPKLSCCCNNLSRKVVFPPGASVADTLSWTRVLHCFSYCDRPLPVGYKCWRFTVPPVHPSSKLLV